MRFLVIPLFLSFISYSWATENIEQPVESSSRDNFLVRLLQLDNQTTGPNIDLGKSTHLSANIIKETAPGHLMIADAGGTNLTAKEKNKETSSKKIELRLNDDVNKIYIQRSPEIIYGLRK